MINFNSVMMVYGVLYVNGNMEKILSIFNKY